MFILTYILILCTYNQIVCRLADALLIAKIKGKGHPITGHEGPEAEQMCSSTLPSTSA